MSALIIWGLLAGVVICLVGFIFFLYRYVVRKELFPQLPNMWKADRNKAVILFVLFIFSLSGFLGAGMLTKGGGGAPGRIAAKPAQTKAKPQGPSFDGQPAPSILAKAGEGDLERVLPAAKSAEPMEQGAQAKTDDEVAGAAKGMSGQAGELQGADKVKESELTQRAATAKQLAAQTSQVKPQAQAEAKPAAQPEKPQAQMAAQAEKAEPAAQVAKAAAAKTPEPQAKPAPQKMAAAKEAAPAEKKPEAAAEKKPAPPAKPEVKAEPKPAAKPQPKAKVAAKPAQPAEKSAKKTAASAKPRPAAKKPAAEPETGKPFKGPGWTVCAGSFLDAKRADRVIKELRGKGLPVWTTRAVVKGKKWRRVCLGGFKSSAQAQKQAAQWEKAGLIKKYFFARVK